MRELSEATGLHYQTVREYLKALHKQRVIHIATWEHDSMGRATHRVYMLGQGKDAPKPTIPRVEMQRRYRARIKAAQHLAVLAGKAAYVQHANNRVTAA